MSIISGSLRTICLISYAAWFLLLVACAATISTPTMPLDTSIRGAITPEKVRLAPGDEVEIKFYYTPELNETQTIRPDGKITLQLINDVEAKGLTPEELTTVIEKLYKPYFKEPAVSVMVRTLASQRVFVGGEVNKPGAIQLDGNVTLLQAIMEAGGFIKESAKLSNVVVMRQEEGKWYAGTFDLRNVVKGKASDSFYLKSMDIVYVPRTRINKVNQWVEQYITRMIPGLGSITGFAR
jgi:polysaccharide export outer membrane protein